MSEWGDATDGWTEANDAAIKAERDSCRTPMSALDQAMTEAELQVVVEDALHTFGWRFHHETDSRRSRAGMPDIFAVHPKSGWWALLELKAEKGRLRSEQREWLRDARTVCAPSGDVEMLWTDRYVQRITGVVRPSNVDELIGYLRVCAQPSD